MLSNMQIELIKEEISELINHNLNSYYVFRTRLERLLVRIENLNINNPDLLSTFRNVKERICCGSYGDSNPNMIKLSDSNYSFKEDLTNLYHLLSIEY